MTLDAERLEILKMVEAGQISPEDGSRLLAVLDSEGGRTGPARAGGVAVGGGRWIKLLFEEAGGQRVNISLPITAMPVMLRVAARWIPEEHLHVLQGAADAISTGLRGDLVHVEEPGGQRVRIWLE
jgi:hypothetical protein